jgi:hypothetical protein
VARPDPAAQHLCELIRAGVPPSTGARLRHLRDLQSPREDHRAGLRLWAAILRSVPNSRLVLKERLLTLEYSRNAVLGTLAAEGISADRVILLGHMSRAAHFASYAAPPASWAQKLGGTRLAIKVPIVQSCFHQKHRRGLNAPRGILAGADWGVSESQLSRSA